MYSMWLTDEQQEIWRDYLAMASRLQTAMHRQLQQDCELSLSDYDVLVALSERGPLRINELGDALAWEQSRLSHQLRRMRGRGLVARQGSDDDRRGATVDLTDAGRAALEVAAPGHVELVRSAMFDGMPEARLRAFGAVAKAVSERLTTSPPRRT
ncbi:MarR family winged helix-turn-helix transcriptional regulator [Mycolicibacterium tusciae]|jgi:DNA-binding MarR family transcriptional regulator|uniref:MarR family transcriptional regulator n=1 Tax=Mycolicibacterium tusciae TaxID=75922 RepID=A0A1X0JGY8_9MYCO|nr:MarR family winged helix-turn-helix transcriptional regulator [Mycolicibacterium tusciae]ORB62189.1 MarR family transcriptional regulator [Mycolicibacterium tusciae]